MKTDAMKPSDVSFTQRGPGSIRWRLLTLGAALLGVISSGPTVRAEVFQVDSAQAIASAMAQAQPGDTLVMKEGNWENQRIDFVGHGTDERPITLESATPGKVVLTGSSMLRISGSHLVAKGLYFLDGTLEESEHVVQFRGPLGNATNCRLTQSAIEAYHPEDPEGRFFYVSIYGQDNRVDHNHFSKHKESGVTVVAWLDDAPARHRIDANRFTDRPKGEGNGFETIRIGTSQTSGTDAQVLVERNLFERVDGEIELISNKSNGNIYRHNIIRDCAGTITLRHGNRCVVDGNLILGKGKKHSGGVRVIGQQHQIINNYIEDIDDRAGGAISLSASVPDSPSSGYARVADVLIAHNTLIDIDGPALKLDAGYGSKGRSELPTNVTIAGNLIVHAEGGLVKGSEGDDFRWEDNLIFPLVDGFDREVGSNADPQLNRSPSGLLIPSSQGPASKSVQTLWTDHDRLERPRHLPADAGSETLDQGNDSVPLLAVTAEIGPGWQEQD